VSVICHRCQKHRATRKGRTCSRCSYLRAKERKAGAPKMRLGRPPRLPAEKLCADAQDPRHRVWRCRVCRTRREAELRAGAPKLNPGRAPEGRERGLVQLDRRYKQYSDRSPVPEELRRELLAMARDLGIVE
jgi:hypothetical protein